MPVFDNMAEQRNLGNGRRCHMHKLDNGTVVVVHFQQGDPNQYNVQGIAADGAVFHKSSHERLYSCNLAIQEIVDTTQGAQDGPSEWWNK